MSGKMTASRSSRVDARSRESRKIKRPELDGLNGSVRGSKPVNGGSRLSQATAPPMKPRDKLVVDQARYRAPTQFDRAAQHLRWQREGTTDIAT